MPQQAFHVNYSSFRQRQYRGLVQHEVLDSACRLRDAEPSSSAPSKFVMGDISEGSSGMKLQAVDSGRRLSGRLFLHAMDSHFKSTEIDGCRGCYHKGRRPRKLLE